MNTIFKPDTFRNDFTFANSPAAIKRFPFPFCEDTYTYSLDMESHVAGPAGNVYEYPIDIDDHYVSDKADRAHV